MINEKRLLDTFIGYAMIDSETKNEKAMGEKLVEDLKALGLEVKTDKAGEGFGSNGFNVCAYLPGTIPGEPTIMCAHMDTVTPGNGIKPLIDDGIIHTDGSTILSGDDKSGIAAIMEAVKVIKEQNLPCRNTEILFTIGEEGGMNGVKNMDLSMITGKEAMVFDASGDVGKILTCGPGQIKIFATIIGRSSHAGLAPEEGISAIQVAAKGIAKKIAYLFVITVAIVIDYILAKTSGNLGYHLPSAMLSLLTTVWYLLNEALSITENAGRMGAPVPEWLMKYIAVLKDKIDSSNETNLKE